MSESNISVDPPGEPLSGTDPLAMNGDIASNLVDAADVFLLEKLEAAIAERARHWKRDCSSPEAYIGSVAENRNKLAHLLGLREVRVQEPELKFVSSPQRPSQLGRGNGYEIHFVEWSSFADVTGEGLLLEPDQEPVANIIAIPDADVHPEQLVGLVSGISDVAQYARRLVEAGCRVIVPALVDRGEYKEGISRREFVYRSAFELGRHLIGYEILKIQSALDALEGFEPPKPTGVIGWGEGGLLSLYAAALDQRIDAACVSGYFDSRQNAWNEPIERNVFGLLEQFGDAEIASLVAPRSLVIEMAPFPIRKVEPGSGSGAPCGIRTPGPEAVRREFDRAQSFVKGLAGADLKLVEGNDPVGSGTALDALLSSLGSETASSLGSAPENTGELPDPEQRQLRLVHQLDRHNQHLLGQSASVRDSYFEDLDCSSLESYEETIESYRRTFADEVIGRFEDDLIPFNARTRLVYDAGNWKGYEVVLDVYRGLFAYGILAIPNDISEDEQRPAVVCQHGLEGRPQVVMAGSHDAYNDFGAALCKRGFVVFAPQNLYIFTDRFRSLQRKPYLLKKTLFSMMVPQHQQVTEWLKQLSFVDGERIGFYGISYGGKTAMRVPPLVDNYCLSICSADFNEWVWKNASTGNPYTYSDKGEYEIFEWDLGSTFNYAEMARLICPRPFMVERGHADGVAPDETVAYEYAKVKRHYDQLGIGDRTEMEVFIGGHEINGEDTFRFLHRHLDWPEP